MKAVISSTYDNLYLFFIPITVWAWNKLDIGVICFVPRTTNQNERDKLQLGLNSANFGYNENDIFYFDAPKQKEVTYAQVSRLYAACLDLPEDEILITSDADMLTFNKEYFDTGWNGIEVFGSDLVGKDQYPLCYIKMPVSSWRDIMEVNGRTYQECLDDEIGTLESIHFRGDFWCRDQWLIRQQISKINARPHGLKYAVYEHARTNGQNQFATRRLDRDDAFIMDRLSPDILDFHMNRPGHDDGNFGKILSVIKYFYPEDNLDWMVEYHQEYKKLL